MARLDQVQAPAMSISTNMQFFSREDPSKPDIAFLKNHFYREGRVTEEQAMFILEKGNALSQICWTLTRPSSVSGRASLVLCGAGTDRLYAPSVCGDIHGQYVST